MRLHCISGYLAAVIAACGCYGIKPPLPDRSGLGPSTSASTIPLSRPPALPAALTDLIAAYRQAPCCKSAPHATRHGGAACRNEVQTMAASYEGREAGMRTEIERRMTLPATRPQATSEQGAANFPVDPQELNRNRR